MPPAQYLWPIVWAAGAGAGSIAWLLKYMIVDEPNLIEISRYEVITTDLPAELDGAVICQVSDPHITTAPRNRAAVAKAIRSVKADLFVITGDLIYGQQG